MSADAYSPDFDHVFRVLPDGSTQDVPNVYAPDVTHCDAHDIEISSGEDWSALTGYTGQHGYRGAVLHPSEYFGGGLYRDVMSTPGVYVLTVVRDEDADRDAGDDDAVGWTVLRLEES